MSKVTILTKPNRIVIASKGVQGPPGADGDLTPELEQARDEAVQAALDAAQSASDAQDALDAMPVWVEMGQAEYDAITTPDPNTRYVIVGP